MMVRLKRLKQLVHCHVGSLEKAKNNKCHRHYVHCHVGSLESSATAHTHKLRVHCHVGSLEIMVIWQMSN